MAEYLPIGGSLGIPLAGSRAGAAPARRPMSAAPRRPQARSAAPARKAGLSPARESGQSASPRRAGGDRPASAAGGRGGERVVLLLLGAAALGLLAAGAFALAPQVLRITRIEISGASSLGRGEILAAALLPETPYLFSVDPERVRRALLAEPRIKEARVTRLFPDGLSIGIEERAAVAAVVVEIGGRSALAEIDGEGMVFGVSRAAATTEGAAAPSSVPVLSGIRFEDFRAGTRLPPSFLPLLRSLALLRTEEPALLEAFSEVQVVRTAYGELELLLYPLRQRIPVRTGADLNGEVLRSIILVLDVLASRLGTDGVDEIDFRAGTVVYRAKEGHPG